ncbi:uncharacterized protein LOC126838246 isoform X2 [Adelges cooleyi]|uniref:uncharacterized protein LOC126838246 isoform X2 n=1 Tax=Adelges cooleyi TaxID=133065 RepID=UPI00217F4952|nr:uncharacterized protein LOC126838246 isoform X2 [Adelges cooleyi]
MKLIYVIASFAMVNFCVAVLDKHTKKVIQTNIHIQLVEDHLPKIMRKVILDKQQKRKNMERPIESLTIMNLLIAQTDHSEELARLQAFLQNEIKEITEIKEPRIPKYAPYENLTLEKLGEDRRELTLVAVKKLINSTLDGKDLDFNESYPGFGNYCRLLGLFKSIENPGSYVYSAEVEDIRNQNTGLVEKRQCVIKAVNAGEIRYEYLGGQLWQLQFNDSGPPYYSLASQTLYC